MDLRAKIAKGDYSTRPRRELVLDNAALKLKAENEKVKQEFRQGLNRDRLKQRSPREKVANALVKGARAFVLSGPSVLGKLTAAAIARAVVTPAEEAVGAGLHSAFPELSAKAPRHGGGLNLKAETKAITEGVTTGMQDAWATLRTGKSPLDLVYGHDPGIPQSFMDIFGNIHGALKAPIKRAEFSRAFAKRMDSAAKQGVDISNEWTQLRIGVEAYQDANRSIFLQKNILNDAYKRLLSRFEEKEKATGKPSGAGLALDTAARVALPITKVPSNIVGETMEFALGSVTGGVKLAKAYREGIEKLPPEQADLIMRQLKKGSLGAAIILLGFLNPQVIGGFYQQGEKRKKTDVQPGAARVAGHNIPPQVLDNPLAMAAELGATIRRVADSKLRKRDKFTQGIPEGVLASALGLADATPFVRETVDSAKMLNPYERDQYFGELAKSRLEPQLLQWLAQKQDVTTNGVPVKRKPANFGQRLETGIPYLRERVPKNPKQ